MKAVEMLKMRCAMCRSKWLASSNAKKKCPFCGSGSTTTTGKA